MAPFTPVFTIPGMGIGSKKSGLSFALVLSSLGNVFSVLETRSLNYLLSVPCILNSTIYIMNTIYYANFLLAVLVQTESASSLSYEGNQAGRTAKYPSQVVR